MPEPATGGKLAFLKKKELGLPLYVWLGIAAVLMALLYRHYKSSAGSAAANPAAPTQAPPAEVATPSDNGTSGGGSSGGAADNSGLLAELASGLQTIEQGQNDLLAAWQAPPVDTSGSGDGSGGDGSGSGTGSSSGTTPPVTTPNGIEWGGQTFTTRSQFDAWLKARGESWKQYKVKYPKAYAEYLNLPAGKQATAKDTATKKPPTTDAPAQRQTTTTTVRSSLKTTPPRRIQKRVPPRRPVRGGKI